MVDLSERLTPSHLVPDIPEKTDDLKAEVEASVPEKAEEKKPNLEDPRLQSKYTFSFEWEDGRGKVWKGEFTNKILTIGDRQKSGILRARLGGNLPADSLDPLTAELNMMVAHMTFSLVEKPAWAEDLRALENFQLVQNLYMEVAQHEGTFLGLNFGESEG